MRNVRPDGSQRDFYSYGTNPEAFTAAQARPLTIQVQSDAAFELAYITAHTSDALGFMLQITDNGSNLRLSNVPVRFDLVTGTAQRPFVCPETHIFPANGSILLDVTSLAAGANTISIILHGWKRYRDAGGTPGGRA